MTHTGQSLRERMQADLPAALRAGDTSRVGVLRTTLAALANAEAVDPSGDVERAGLLGDVARRALSDDDVDAIVRAEQDDLRSTATHVRAGGYAEAADELLARAAILEDYLSDR